MKSQTLVIGLEDSVFTAELSAKDWIRTTPGTSIYLFLGWRPPSVLCTE